MGLLSNLEVGWWNAWIILVGGLAAAFAPLLVRGATVEARMAGEASLGEADARVRGATVVTHVVLWPAALLYSVFVPLERGSWWLATGLTVSGIAIAMQLAASIAFATAPIGVPMTSGAYAVSRHPMYVAGTLLFIGAGLAATSWVFLVAALVWFAAWVVEVPVEEQAMLDKYGPAYERYRERTPRWLGVPRTRRIGRPSASPPAARVG